MRKRDIFECICCCYNVWLQIYRTVGTLVFDEFPHELNSRGRELDPYGNSFIFEMFEPFCPRLFTVNCDISLYKYIFQVCAYVCDMILIRFIHDKFLTAHKWISITIFNLCKYISSLTEYNTNLRINYLCSSFVGGKRPRACKIKITIILVKSTKNIKLKKDKNR